MNTTNTYKVEDCGMCHNPVCPKCYPDACVNEATNSDQAKKDELFRNVARDIAEVLVRKNHDYGDSFHDLYSEFGDLSTYMRLYDKMGRLKNLIKQMDMRVNESIEDVFRDIAGYCILTLASRERLDLGSESKDIKHYEDDHTCDTDYQRVNFSVKERIFSSAEMAMAALAKLLECSRKHGFASVADYYNIVGAIGTISDENYGWPHNLIYDAFVTSVGGGHLLRLPPVMELVNSK